MIRHRIAFLLLVLLSTAAFAQPAQQPISAAQRRQLAEILPHLLETVYVVPEKGRELAAQVRKAFESGRYASATTVPALAEAVNRDLAGANDRHLAIRYNPERASGSVLTIDDWNAQRAARRRPMQGSGNRDALSVVAVEVLDGNIGYLRVREFVSTDEARSALSHAMALLANTDAVIVDVRTCPGGSADTVSHLASYFFGPEPRVLMNRYDRRTDTSSKSTTVDVPGRRMPNAGLYILAGPESASACESFAFTLQQWDRAKVVGEKTAGAGYNNTLIDIGLGLTFSISFGTATHPKTGKQFEAVGVQPDIAVPAEHALDAARADALRVRETKVTQSATPAPSAKLESYVGTYGVREITISDGKLHYQRIGARGGELKPLARDQFDLNGDVIVTFLRRSDGAVTAMRIQWKDGKSETVPKQ